MCTKRRNDPRIDAHGVGAKLSRLATEHKRRKPPGPLPSLAEIDRAACRRLGEDPKSPEGRKLLHRLATNRKQERYPQDHLEALGHVCGCGANWEILYSACNPEDFVEDCLAGIEETEDMNAVLRFTLRPEDPECVDPDISILSLEVSRQQPDAGREEGLPVFMEASFDVIDGVKGAIVCFQRVRIVVEFEGSACARKEGRLGREATISLNAGKAEINAEGVSSRPVWIVTSKQGGLRGAIFSDEAPLFFLEQMQAGDGVTARLGICLKQATPDLIGADGEPLPNANLLAIKRRLKQKALCPEADHNGWITLSLQRLSVEAVE